jgi:tRNA threonylcarbamoyl adenosine modification protein (Sua5/YciO/YrdC/YwlC family)
VESLHRGGVIAYPTDTSYGLGCDLFEKSAIERIYTITQMDKKHQLSFICADMSNVSEYAVMSDFAFRSMKRLLPGPYTFILPAARIVPKFMITDKRKTVGIRIPDHEVPLALVRELGHPIITTTAGIEGEEPLASAAQIADAMGKHVEVILDTGILQFDESSVVDLTGDEPVVIREGKGDISIFQ